MKAINQDELVPLAQNLTDQQVLALYHAGRIPYVQRADDDPIKMHLCTMFSDMPLCSFQLNVLAEAVRMNFFRIADDDHLEWLFEEKTLLAYFVGRLWCGDRPYFSQRRKCYCWHQGDAHFPTLAVERYFKEKKLRDYRRRRNLKKNPENSQLVDYLFVICGNK